MGNQGKLQTITPILTTEASRAIFSQSRTIKPCKIKTQLQCLLDMPDKPFLNRLIRPRWMGCHALGGGGSTAANAHYSRLANFASSSGSLSRNFSNFSSSHSFASKTIFATSNISSHCSELPEATALNAASGSFRKDL
jgi:hypothetical protein